MQRSRSHLEDHALNQKENPHTFRKVQQFRDLSVQHQKQHLYIEQNQINHEEHLAYNQQASEMSQGQNSSVGLSSALNPFVRGGQAVHLLL
ncbi:hypothetical protein Btru_053536 [Bulinus truncatus]|nr:hypothetical protein Btru_053536 [Bulinus truncatus]